MHDKILIFDIETIPCTETARNLLGLDDSMPDAGVIQKLTDYHLEITSNQNSFHRQLFHRVLCISFIVCDIERLERSEFYSFNTIKTGGRKLESEKEILEKFCDYISKHRPRLISFNGRTFDLPVIQYRSMKHQIPCPWVYSKDYSYKYSLAGHCDLLEAFSNFGSSARVKMSEVASLFGIPCKQNASGAEVYPMYLDGKIEEICDYCESDVVCTYMLYLQYAYHAGIINKSSFEKAYEKAMSIA